MRGATTRGGDHLSGLAVVGVGIGGLVLAALGFVVTPLLGILAILGCATALVMMNRAGWFKSGPHEPMNRMWQAQA